MIRLQVDTRLAIDQLRTFYKHLSDEDFARAIAIGLNDTMKQVRTQVGRAVREKYNIRAGYLTGKYLKIKPAYARGKASRLSTELSMSTLPIPMAQFTVARVKPNKTAKGRMPVIQTGGKGLGSLKSKSISTIRRGIGTVASKKTGGGILIEVLKGHREFVPSAFISPLSHMVVARSNTVSNKSYNIGSQKDFNWRHKRIAEQDKDTPVGALFSKAPFWTAVDSRVQSRLATFIDSKMDRIILNRLDAMAKGAIRNASNRGRYK